MGININNRTPYIIMINQNIKERERWNPIPIFPMEATTFCLVFLSSQQIPTNFYYSILYLSNLLLEYSVVPCGFDIRH